MAKNNVDKYKTIKNPLRYYIVYDADGNDVADGTYYEILQELNISEGDFNNYLRPSKTVYQKGYQIIEIIPDSAEDEVKNYYECLLKIKDKKISFSLILKIIQACGEHHYLEQLSRDNSKLGLFSYDQETSLPTFVAINLIMQTYALLTISDDLTLEEISSYYNVPMWLILVVDDNYENIFEQ